MTEAMTQAFSTAIGQIQTDVTGMVTTALPVALGLFGIGMALRWGKNFFASLAS